MFHRTYHCVKNVNHQPGKKAMDLIIDFLSCLWEYAKEQITREIGAVADLGASRRSLRLTSHTDPPVSSAPHSYWCCHWYFPTHLKLPSLNRLGGSLAYGSGCLGRKGV